MTIAVHPQAASEPTIDPFGWMASGLFLSHVRIELHHGAKRSATTIVKD